MRFLFATTAAVLLTASSTFAQSEAVLKQRFEGTSVFLKIDMPGSQQGVNIYPTSQSPVDFGAVAQGIKRYGIGVHEGESIMISKIRVKDKVMEVHLGGGGFGTFTDRLTAPDAGPILTMTSKSRREKDLEDELRYATDFGRRRYLQRELDDLRRDRNRDDAWRTTTNAQRQREQNVIDREQRAQSGSRFNIRYDAGFPEGSLTPEGLMATLAKYVDFSNENSSTKPAAPSSSNSPITAIRKGFTIAQVEQIVGPATTADSKRDGSMDVMERRYSAEGQRITAKFVGGILVDYSIAPQ
jgi:hypothetical protein